MKVFVKTLRGTTFEIEVKPEETVADVKKIIETAQGADVYPAPQQMLIHQAKVLKDTTTLEENKVAENSFIVIMLTKTVRPSPLSGRFNRLGYRPHGPGGPQWGSQGSHPAQPSSYDYQQQGPYPSHNHPPTYGGGYPQHLGPRSGFGSGWEQRPPPNMQGMPPHGCGYDYYGGQGADAQHSTPSPGMGPPPSQGNYYGQPHGLVYGHPAPYSQAAPPQHSYWHGYEEPKYDNYAPTQHPYGGHGASQPCPQTGAQAGYGPQQHYGRPPAYGMPSQEPTPQSYGPAQSYGPNVPAQQPYPYVSTGPAQQTYPAYGSAPATDGYNQPPPASGSGYPQQGAQPEERGAIERLEAMGFDRALVLEVYSACNKNEELAANYLLDHMHEFEE